MTKAVLRQKLISQAWENLICAWINRLDLHNVDYSASNISRLKGCQMAYICNRVVLHDLHFCHLYPNVTSSKFCADCFSLWTQIAVLFPLPFYIVRSGQFNLTFSHLAFLLMIWWQIKTLSAIKTVHTVALRQIMLIIFTACQCNMTIRNMCGGTANGRARIITDTLFILAACKFENSNAPASKYRAFACSCVSLWHVGLIFQ